MYADVGPAHAAVRPFAAVPAFAGGADVPAFAGGADVPAFVAGVDADLADGAGLD